MQNINLYGMTLPEKVAALEKAFRALSEEIKEVSQVAGVSSSENYSTPDYNYNINSLFNPSGDKAINVKANMRVFFANAYYAIIEKIVYDSDGVPYAFNTYQGIELKGEHGTNGTNGLNGNGIVSMHSLRHSTENSETITTVEVVTDESNMEFEVHAKNGSSSIIYNSSQNATVSQGGYSVSRDNLSPVLGSPTIDDYVIANIDQNGETKSALFHVLAYNTSTNIVSMAFVTYLKGDKGEKGDTNFKYTVQCTVTFGADKINIFGLTKTSPDMGLIYDSNTFYQAFKQGSDFIGICNGVLCNVFFDTGYNPVIVTEIGVNAAKNIIISAVIIKGHNGNPQNILAEKVTKELSVSSPLFSDFTGIVSPL